MSTSILLSNGLICPSAVNIRPQKAVLQGRRGALIVMAAIQSGVPVEKRKIIEAAGADGTTGAGICDCSGSLGALIAGVSADLRNDEINAGQTPPVRMGPAPSSDWSCASSLMQHLLNLFSAISSDDSPGARSAYSTLMGVLDPDRTWISQCEFCVWADHRAFAKLIWAIEPALSSGDMRSAQSAMKSFLADLTWFALSSMRDLVSRANENGVRSVSPVAMARLQARR